MGGENSCINPACYEMVHRAPDLEGRPSSRREDNIKIDLIEVALVGVDQIHVAQDSDRW